MILDLTEAPNLTLVVRAASPSYRKHKAIVYARNRVQLQGQQWDGGSRSGYIAVSLTTLRTSTLTPDAEGYAQVTPGMAVVETGIFRGKTATAAVYVHPDSAHLVLPKGVTL